MKRFLLILLLLPSLADASTRRHDVDESEHLQLAAQHPAVAMYAWGCTATLVAPDKAITAAHCVDDDGDGEFDRPVVGEDFLLGDDAEDPTHERTVTRVVTCPAWDAELRAFDVAVLTLDAPIDDVAPVAISGRDPLGSMGTVVEFGIAGTGTDADFWSTEPDGLKRAAQNMIELVDAEFGTEALLADFDSPAGDANTLATHYGADSDAEPLALEGVAGPGDSGGPLLVDFGDGPRIVGITSGGGNPLSQGGQDELAGRYGSIAEWAHLARAETSTSCGTRVCSSTGSATRSPATTTTTTLDRPAARRP